MEPITYKLTFESPFIIGASVSDPGVFDQVSLLSDGLPYIPASSIRGRVKDAIRQHCTENSNSWKEYALCVPQATGEEDAAKGKKYCGSDSICPLCRIFGNPGGEVTKGFEFSGVYIPEREAELLKKFYEGSSADSMYHRRSRNKRDYLLRRSQEDALFSLGMADPPTCLEGKIVEKPLHARYDLKIREFDHAIIILGLRLVTELGGGRNRGAGRCEFSPSGDWKGIISTHINNWKQAKVQGAPAL